MELDFSEQIRQLGICNKNQAKASYPMGTGHDQGMVPDKHGATSDAESEDVGSKDDFKQMPMSNKSVCKTCGTSWGSCEHVGDLNNKMQAGEEKTIEPANDGMKNGVIAKKDSVDPEEDPEHESKESKDEETKEDSKASVCPECKMPESECTCGSCGDKAKAGDTYGDPNAEKEIKMEKSMSGKDDKHPDKEDKKDVESEKGNPNAEKEEEKDSKDKNKFPFDKSKATASQKISNMLEKKLVAHNEKHEQNLTFEQLSKVYARGLNVYKTTHKPGISMHEWATARVNLFLKLMSGLPVSTKYSILDNDVATASANKIVESGLASYDYIEFSDLEFQLAKISLLDAGFAQREFNELFSQAEEKKK
jgi:hypothetical protein